MKIAFISTMAGFPWGGSEELWFKTAKLALYKGHQVYTLTKYWEQVPPNISLLKSLGAITEFYNKKKAGRKSRLERIKNRIRLKLGYKKTSKQNEYANLTADFFIISNGGTLDMIYNSQLCEVIMRSGKPYFIISQHNFESGFVIDNYIRDFAISFISKAEKFFFVSQRNLLTAERQLAYTISNSQIIANPIKLHKVGIKPFPHSDTLLLACVARLDCNFKGQDILLQVLGQPQWRNRDFILKFYGTGPHEVHLRYLIDFYNLSNKVHLIGEVEDIDEIWENNQVLILPSLSEGTPLALVEAMLSGRSAITTDVGDNERYVLDGFTGYLAAAASVKGLALALEKLWVNRDKIEMMGENAFNHSYKISSFDSDKIILDLIDV